MCKIDQGVIFEYCSQNKVIWGGNKCSWTLKELLAWLIREKKKRMHFGSLIKGFDLIIDIYKENASLVSLIAFIVINNLLVLENHI